MNIRRLLSRPGVVLILAWAGLSCGHAENPAAVAEVLKLKNAAVADETIVAFIQSGNASYNLTADDLLSLREKGLSSAVLNAMLSSGISPRPPAPTPAAAQGPAAPGSPVPAAPTAPPAPVASTAPQVPTAVAAPASPPTTLPPAANPDAAYFYQELSPYGRWIMAEDNQWYWQPSVVLTTPEWRPYWDKGHWVWSDQGWYWVSEYSWGWAPFHYGRWHLHPHHGWIWSPDRLWGPAWVVWRTGGDYCGWAPLPPGAVYDTVSAGFIFHGSHVAVGFDFGLGWNHFAFCHIHELGEPLHAHYHGEREAHAIFERTAVINTYSVRHGPVGGESRVQIVNHGVDPERVTAARGHAVETVRIHDLDTLAPRGGHEHFDNKSRTIEVYRPRLGGHHQ